MKKKILLLFFLFSGLFIYAQDLVLVSPQFNDTLFSPAEINIEAKSLDYKVGQPAHLHIVNTLGGYRKLKLGNNPSSLYSPKVNVIASGNNQLKIVLRKVSGTVDWTKIRFRPSSLGTLSLKKYADSVGGINSDWVTLLISLSDFDATIDFSQLALIEFPYSADATAFELDIAKIEFIGGSIPYLWYGDTKTNNIHDGFGGAGQLVATRIEAIEAYNTLDLIELYVNNSLIGTDAIYPFEFKITLNTIGLNNIYTKAKFKDNSFKTSANYQVFIREFIPLDLNITITSPKSTDTLIINSLLKLQTNIVGAVPSQPAYLLVKNQNSGYLKLKLGYDPVNIYASGKNVIAGGNNKLRITLKNLSVFTNWSKLRLRPKSLGSLNLEPYVLAVGGIDNEWTTIEIPLSDFDPLIDFTNLNYIEFPYSADAGAFQLAVKDIVFTGGEKDFRWFGEDKTDNSHDGFGGSGQLIAEIIAAKSDENSIKQVDFFINDNLVNTDYYYPFETKFIPETSGEYSAKAKVITNNSQVAISRAVIFNIVKPENPKSKLKISFLEPKSGDSVMINQNLNFIPFIEGEDLEKDIYLKTWNTETGYRKLKFGYHNKYIYGQFQNVIAGGNNTMEITLKAFSSNIKWDKIRIRPSAIGLLTLNKYISKETNDWITIKIPLSDFDPTIDFSKLSFFEFPYSADAGAFEIGIKTVKFIGGTTPFEWFRSNHYNNIHDGTGANGSIFAQLKLPNPNPILADTVYFKVNDIITDFSVNPPYTFSYSATNVSNANFSFELIDNYGYKAISDPIAIKFYDLIGDDYSVLSLFFDKDPGVVQVSISPLKYNKDFAFSFTLDDGKIDGYSYAFKLLKGGTIAETGESFPGLFYSDGCGKAIPFRASIAWNSVNSSFNDIHINTPDYITWPQLQEMISAGWNVLNHSYSHAAYGETDYNFQITENQDAVLAKTAYEMTHFVIPSGDLLYVNPAFANGMQAVYSNKIEFLGYNNGIDIDSPFSTEKLKIYRRYMYDDLFNTSNIMTKINEVASKSINGNHIWYHDFTHRVIPTPTGGSLVWNTFKYYMQQIADNYGFNGADRVWFAPPMEILNYLKLRENTSLSHSKSGNRVDIYLNTSQIPTNFTDYFLSLNVSANAELLSVSSQFNANINFANPTSIQKLLNIEWSQPTMKRMQSVASPYSSEDEIDSLTFNIYPNPISGASKLFINYRSNNEDIVFITLVNARGQEIMQSSFNGKSGLNSFEFVVPDLNKGIYFLLFKTDNQAIKAEKIIVQ